MALFKKHLTLDAILKAIADLSPEGKAKVRAAVDDADEMPPAGPDDETPAEATTDCEENSSAESAGSTDGTGETAEKATTESGAEAAESTATAAPTPDATPESVESTVAETHDETAQDEEADEHGAEIIKALADRILALEDRMKALAELKDRMEEYNARNAESFGYRSKPSDKLRDIADMSASELKEKILSGQR